jgi:hypothetical protein
MCSGRHLSRCLLLAISRELMSVPVMR